MRTLLKTLSTTTIGRIAIAASFCGLLGFASPAFSQVSVGLDLHLGAPAPHYEVAPAAPFYGAIWAPGRYVVEPRTRRYVWTPGVWNHPAMERAEIRHAEFADRGFDRDRHENMQGHDRVMQQNHSSAQQSRSGRAGNDGRR
jgi:hypothetical protein